MRQLKVFTSRALNFIRLLDKPNHLANIRTARRVIRRLAELAISGAEEPQILAYLRKVSPDVFEELVLDLYERQGHIVIRNRRYTGDGGIDGRVFLPAGLTAIQCKRYTGYIDCNHVRAFAKVAARFPGGGIFAHTGKTGEESFQLFNQPGLVLTSGFGLAKMASGQRPPAWLLKPVPRSQALREVVPSIHIRQQ